MVLAVFVLTELRRRIPLFPFSIFRIKGLAAADATQMIAFAGFVSLFFFLTLYMQDVLGYSPIQGGSAYLPVTVSWPLPGSHLGCSLASAPGRSPSPAR